MQIQRLQPILGAIALALLCLPAALATSATAHEGLVGRANPDFPAPDVDPFYKPSGNLAAARRGQVLRRRSFPSVFAGPDLEKSFHLLYRTEDTFNQPEATVASIFVPAKPSSPPRILSVQAWVDSNSPDCAYSWAVVKDSGSGTAIENFLDPGTYIKWALSKGYYVVTPDFLGPKSTFIAGYQSGQAILDGIKALIRDQNLPKDTAVGMVGYSGGAHATVWASTLHEKYAPELNIVGAAHGGTPIDPKNTLLFLNGGHYAGFAAAGLIGLKDTYPKLDAYIESIITDKGRTVLSRFKQAGYCVLQVSGSESDGLNIFNYTTVKDPLDNPVAVEVLKRESLLESYADRELPVPKFPRFLYHALGDDIVPYNDEQQYVKDQCARGANIQFSTLLLANHLVGVFAGVAPSIDFLQQAFEDKTPNVACGSVLPALEISLDSNKADDVMGKGVADQARAGRDKAEGLFGGLGSSHRRRFVRDRRGRN
ncbi:uncharacterized protein PFL1_01560 [Pseudozyma flocculosa PF-1]|uniref:triacylglycerol lipase n=1 Tax=Pseudozyma flocculosa TaxID=84751 RepID=A0A5C3F0N6_9BASI|nr:uncharacterized protein PFL1_01560 [Pseudozyma flocculosa PF-1]EPQ30659.1 hypothetical protein PFL1_01560 [Pseudozyma flocculosa PF-1]SPO37009.1 related to lipase precursor [Pseudozyma flocculosa]